MKKVNIQQICCFLCINYHLLSSSKGIKLMFGVFLQLVIIFVFSLVIFYCSHSRLYFILYSFWYTAKFYVCDIVGGVLPVFALFDICPTCEVSKMYLTSQWISNKIHCYICPVHDSCTQKTPGDHHTISVYEYQFAK